MTKSILKKSHIIDKIEVEIKDPKKKIQKLI